MKLDSKMLNLNAGMFPNSNKPEDMFDNLRRADNARAEYVMCEIRLRFDMLHNKDNEIKKLQYERDLIEEDIIGGIKNDIASFCYNIFRMSTPNLLDQAWRYHYLKSEERLHELGNKEKKELKSSYDYVVLMVKRQLVPEKYHDKMKLTDVYNWCYSTAYEFRFELKNLNFNIFIPNFQSANSKNYLELVMGYRLEFDVGDHCQETVIKDINPEKFKERMGMWLEEKLNEKRK